MKRRFAVGLVCVILMGMLAGCGSSSMKSMMNGAVREDAGMVDVKVSESVMEEMDAGLSSDSAAPQVEDSNRKLIKTVEMTVETKEYDVMLKG